MPLRPAVSFGLPNVDSWTAALVPVIEKYVFLAGLCPDSFDNFVGHFGSRPDRLEFQTITEIRDHVRLAAAIFALHDCFNRRSPFGASALPFPEPLCGPTAI